MSNPATKRTARPRPLALAYIRVSTVEQAESGASLDAQRAILTAEAERRGWDVELVPEEGRSAKSITGRPRLVEALGRLDAGEADVLLAVRLDRVSRSVADFAGLLDRAARRGWGLVLLDPSIDTANPAGRFTANVLASAAQYERELIGVRTREGMAQRKADGWAPTTKKPQGRPAGRPRGVTAETVARIEADRAAGLSFAKIAEALTAEGVPTSQGGRRWYPGSVRDALVAKSAPVAG